MLFYLLKINSKVSHCERSEAISKKSEGLLRRYSPRNDTQLENIYTKHSKIHFEICGINKFHG
jgi:hypothetical protein